MLPNEYVMLALRKEAGRIAFIDNKGFLSKTCPEDATVFVDKHDAYKLAVVAPQNSVPVVRLPSSRSLPYPRIQAMTMPSVEGFRVASGFAHNESLSSLQLAIWMENKGGVPRSHEFLAAGPELKISFQMEVFKGYD